MLVNGELDTVPEEYFMYKGTIEDVIAEYEKSKQPVAA